MEVISFEDKQKVFFEISSMIEDLFEIPKENIKMESRLYDDLDLDSIDAVDLIVSLQEKVGRRVQPEQFKEVRTIEDVVNAAINVLKESETV